MGDRDHHSPDEGMRRSRSITALPEYLDLELLQSDEEKTTKEKVLEFLEGYGHHPLRHYYSFFMLLATLYVTALFLVFSLPQFYVRPPTSLLITEWIIMTIFTVDYLARFYCCAHKAQWFFDSMNLIDFFTIMPFWIEVIILVVSPGTEPQKPVGLAFLRIIRLARVFRVFKVGKYTPSMKLVLLALNESKEAFVLMIILVGIIDILTASAVFYAEQTGQTFDHDNQVWYRADGSVSPFQSIFSGCWWAIVTLTTVGYGDVVPATTLGKMVGGVTVLLGVLVLAFPLSIFSSKFYNIYTLSQTQRKPTGPFPGSIPMEQLPRMVHEFDRLELELRSSLDSLKSSIDDTYSKLDHVTQLMERFKRLEALVEHNSTSTTQSERSNA